MLIIRNLVLFQKNALHLEIGLLDAMKERRYSLFLEGLLWALEQLSHPLLNHLL